MPTTKTVHLDEPDIHGAVRYDYFYSDEDGDACDESMASHFVADGYDDSGKRVFGVWGIVSGEE